MVPMILLPPAGPLKRFKHICEKGKHNNIVCRQTLFFIYQECPWCGIEWRIQTDTWDKNLDQIKFIKLLIKEKK